MTEAEWLSCADPAAMLKSLRGEPSERKLRLFVCACCRGVEGLVDEDRGQRAVSMAERYADGAAGKDDLGVARDAASVEAELDWYHCYGWCWNLPFDAWPWVLVAFDPLGLDLATEAAAGAVQCATDLERLRHKQTADALLAAQADLLRCIFGNPYRAVRISPAWRTADVVALAQAAYDERLLPSGELDPLRLQVLADALEEAGCADADIIDHLRKPGPHVPGCFAVDAVRQRG